MLESFKGDEASRLQDDLRRAGINPSWWVINQSWNLLETSDPILQGRAQAESAWMTEVKDRLSKKCSLVRWQITESVGWLNLMNLVEERDELNGQPN